MRHEALRRRIFFCFFSILDNNVDYIVRFFGPFRPFAFHAAAAASGGQFMRDLNRRARRSLLPAAATRKLLLLLLRLLLLMMMMYTPYNHVLVNGTRDPVASLHGRQGKQLPPPSKF